MVEKRVVRDVAGAEPVVDAPVEVADADVEIPEDDGRIVEASGGFPHHRRVGTTASDGLDGWFGG